MSCDDLDRRISVEVPNAGLEIAPYNVDFRRERGKFDYFKASFHSDVGNHIQDEVIYDGGSLSYLQRAYVKMEGDRVYPMVFDPGKVNFGRDLTSIRLLDPIADLGNAFTDMKKETTTGKEVLQELFDHYQKATKEPLLNDLLFPDEISPENSYVVNNGLRMDSETYQEPWEKETAAPGERKAIDNVGKIGRTVFDGAKWSLDYATDLFYKSYAVDYDEETCLHGFLDMTDRMGVNLWTKPANPGSMKFNLCVGKFDKNSIVHEATGYNSDVFKINNYNVSTMDNPVKVVQVRGRIVHDDNLILDRNLENVREAFNPKVSTTDYRATGIASRNIPRGQTVTFDVDAPRDSLAEIAESKMQDLMQRGSSGDIEISPQHSGTGKTDYRNIQVGDVLYVWDFEEEFCKENSQLYENDYVITGVENNISNGYWSINLDVVDKISEENIPEGELRMFDVDSEEYVDPSDIDIVEPAPSPYIENEEEE